MSRPESIMHTNAPPRSALAHLRSYALCLLLPLISVAAAAQEGNLEAKVKAAYLYHLTKFVDWPALPNDVLRICVQGDEAIGVLLNQLSNRQVNNRPLKIEPEFTGDPTQCQVLFIGRADKRLEETLGRVRGQAVLTVSDLEHFTQRGGVVGFYSEGGKIKLEINPETARGSKLKVSAKLFEVARTTP